MARHGFLKGHDHGRLGLHRTGRNTYSRKGVTYQRVHGGFQVVRGHHAAPYDPLQPLTGKSFNREVSAATRLKYGPQERQLASEQRISGAQSQRIGGYFDQYQQDLARAQVATQQGYGQAQQGVYNQANVARGQDTQQAALLQAQAQASAAQRGATAGPGVADQAAAGRQALSSSYGGMIGAQGASASRYAGTQRVAGAQARVGALQDEAKRLRQILQMGRDLQAQKGDYATQYRGDLRDRERTYALNQQAFGLNVQKANQQAAYQKGQLANVRHGQNLVAKSKHLDRALKLRLGKINTALKQQGLSETHRHHLEQERESILRINKPSGSGGGGGYTPTQKMSHQRQYDKGVAFLNRPDILKIFKKHGRSYWVNRLINQGHVDRWAADASWERIRFGGVLPGTSRRLKRLGVRHKRHHKRNIPNTLLGY